MLVDSQTDYLKDNGVKNFLSCITNSMILHFHEKYLSFWVHQCHQEKSVRKQLILIEVRVENKFVNQDKITYCFQGHVLTDLLKKLINI